MTIRITMDLERRTRLSARVERAVEWPMLALAVAMIPVILAPILFDLRPAVDRALTVCEWLIWGAFAAELAVKTYLAPDRRRYLITHWFDVLIVVLPFLRPLRLLRVIAVLTRLGVISRRVMGRRALGYLLIFGALSMVSLAGLVLLIERESEGATITSFGTALWWAAATVTTVGYGDVAPVTWTGRALGVLTMIVGIGLFGVFTANVAAYFVESDAARELPPENEVLQGVVQALRGEVAALRGEAEALRDEVAALRHAREETP